MFADLLRRMTAPEPDTLNGDDSRIALAALLVRLARADGVYDETEKKRIDKTLAARFDLGPLEVTDLRKNAEGLEAEAPDTVRFTRSIKESVAYEDRTQVIEAMWAVVLADGARDDEENSMMRMIAPMLGVNDRDSALARQRVEKKT